MIFLLTTSIFAVLLLMSEVGLWVYVGNLEIAGLIGEWKGTEGDNAEW
jgi:hypothetical protein